MYNFSVLKDGRTPCICHIRWLHLSSESQSYTLHNQLLCVFVYANPAPTTLADRNAEEEHEALRTDPSLSGGDEHLAPPAPYGPPAGLQSQFLLFTHFKWNTNGL